VVIPAVNEAGNLPWVLDRIPQGVDELILVDGKSSDATVEVAKAARPDIRVITQEQRGKGDALAIGFAAATSDVVVTIDADGSMDPAEIVKFVRALVDSKADYAKGSRFLPGGGSDDLTLLRRIGNFLLRSLVNALHGTRYSDLCYGFNAFRRSHLGSLGFSIGVDGEPRCPRMGSGFEIETCLNIRAARAGLRILEVPSYERARSSGKSNLRVIRDGTRIVRAILTERRISFVQRASEIDAFVDGRFPRVGELARLDERDALAVEG